MSHKKIFSKTKNLQNLKIQTFKQSRDMPPETPIEAFPEDDYRQDYGANQYRELQ